jgi:RNA polymerase sigma-70 factor, ECF subfamily
MAYRRILELLPGPLAHGNPAILFWDEGSLAVVLSLTLSAGGIQEIYALLIPRRTRLL